MPGGRSSEFGAYFERAVGDRLLAAERLVAWLPVLLGGHLEECEVAFDPVYRTFVVAGTASGVSEAEVGRFRYWTARSGGMPWDLTGFAPDERRAFDERVSSCTIRSGKVPAARLASAVRGVADRAGAPADRRPAESARPTILMDAGSAAFAGVTWSPDARLLFLPGAVAPPVGDAIWLSLRVPSSARPVEAGAKVVAVRRVEDAVPGAPAGFELAIAPEGTDLVAALERHAGRPDVEGANARAAPRYAMNAPVKIRAEPGPTARLEYASPGGGADHFIENLSQGGAFVRTAEPLPVGTHLDLEMKLPGDVDLAARATVMFRNKRGMGLKFDLDSAGRERLGAVIARIAAPPRRALLVDDDALILRALGDRLAGRGFEVLTAKDGNEGLHLLTSELLSLDLLITDVRMPEMDGEAFVRRIRDEGGESELAIVVITGTVDSKLEQRLEKAGADAVLDKSLGPEDLAAAADAALEQKRKMSAP